MCSHVAVHVGARDRCRQEYQAKTLTPLIIPNSIIPLLGEPDSAFFAWPTLKDSPPTRPRAPSLQKNLGPWISTRLVAFGVLHRRHNKLANHYAAALKNWTDVQRVDPRSCPWTSTFTTHDDTVPDEYGTRTTSVTKENTKSPCCAQCTLCLNATLVCPQKPNANARKKIPPLEHNIFRITAEMQRHFIINQTQPYQGRWCPRKHCRFCHAVTGPGTQSLLPYCLSISPARMIARRTQSAYNLQSVANDPGFAFRPGRLVWSPTQRRNLRNC